MLKRLKIIFGFFLASVVLLSAKISLAQDFGLDPIESTIELSQGDPRAIVARLIQIALSLLGVIVLGLIIYAGFLWMTSGGEEDKVRNAKNILKNAVIGLVIILSAWAITTFLLNKLMAAISGNSINQPAAYSGNNFSAGLGAIGSCSVESVYPENSQTDVPRNTSIIVTFKEEIDPASACVNATGGSCACDNGACSLVNPQVIRIYKQELNDACGANCPAPNSNVTDVAVSLSADSKTMILSPLNYLGSSETNTDYVVKITSGFKKEGGSSMFSTCSASELVWGFEVGSRLDLTPPQVVTKFLFPRPDNLKDQIGVSTASANATAGIFVNGCPKIYSPATLNRVTPEAEVVLNYHGVINRFMVSVPADEPNRAQLFNRNTNALLGVADFTADHKVTFEGYFSLKADSHAAGNSWEVEISPEQLADTLTVANVKYTFAATGENNNIVVRAGGCNTDNQAADIQAKLSGHPDINVARTASRITLTAKMSGSAANGLTLSTSNNSALGLTQFSGGADQATTYIVNDKKDVAMNAAIKVTFNEAMNPTTLSGSASDVASYIRLVNAGGGKSAGATCALNSECLSYKCDAGSCIGNYVNGQFMISNGYKTVEFISDNECGINGCGEKVYCLPPNSELALEIKAADLKTCTSDQDCLAFSPHRSCMMSPLGYRTCQDAGQKNYPLANIAALSGATDTAFNSLDGNRDTVADGPITYFNENNGTTSNKDSYRFSFFVNDQKELSSPRITAITPINGQADITALTDPVEVTFNTLMMSSTLRSGSTIIDNGQNKTEHKFVNLKSEAASPLGYWMISEDKDVSPLDGAPDITVAQIRHSLFSESFSYIAQAGSGVKDVYQNCFKPSAGPSCEATWENPSCCFGLPSNNLDENGNCQ